MRFDQDHKSGYGDILGMAIDKQGYSRYRMADALNKDMCDAENNASGARHDQIETQKSIIGKAAQGREALKKLGGITKEDLMRHIRQGYDSTNASANLKPEPQVLEAVKDVLNGLHPLNEDEINGLERRANNDMTTFSQKKTPQSNTFWNLVETLLDNDERFIKPSELHQRIVTAASDRMKTLETESGKAEQRLAELERSPVEVKDYAIIDETGARQVIESQRTTPDHVRLIEKGANPSRDLHGLILGIVTDFPERETDTPDRLEAAFAATQGKVQPAAAPKIVEVEPPAPPPAAPEAPVAAPAPAATISSTSPGLPMAHSPLGSFGVQRTIRNLDAKPPRPVSVAPELAHLADKYVALFHAYDQQPPSLEPEQLGMQKEQYLDFAMNKLKLPATEAHDFHRATLPGRMTPVPETVIEASTERAANSMREYNTALKTAKQHLADSRAGKDAMVAANELTFFLERRGIDLKKDENAKLKGMIDFAKGKADLNTALKVRAIMKTELDKFAVRTDLPEDLKVEGNMPDVMQNFTRTYEALVEAHGAQQKQLTSALRQAYQNKAGGMSLEQNSATGS